MKLNPDCIRDVMLVLEENLSLVTGPKGYYFNSMYPSSVASILRDREYALHDVMYSLLQLAESGYIVTSNPNICNRVHGYFDTGKILYITPKGHEFIATISNEDTWKKKTSVVLGKLGSVSLSVIESVAKGFSSAVVDGVIHQVSGI